MHKLLIIAVLAAGMLSGCQKSSAPSSTSASAPAGDSLTQQLQKLAGSGANSCGRVGTGGDVKAASDCAMQASQAKRPFYVAYDLPDGEGGSLTVAIAGAADGKMYSLDYNPKGWKPDQTGNAQFSDQNRIAMVNCPAALRVAVSGRVTCFPPQSFGMAGAGGQNPHGGMMNMPATEGGASAHGGMSTKPGVENPHKTAPAPGQGTAPAHTKKPGT